ncbi:MAG: hypothetical protein H7256_02345 [Bdellovibrio sp.]|nr:hypothetical protein [Bdellovibrio sp.]
MFNFFTLKLSAATLGLDPQVQGLTSVMVKTFNQTLQNQLAPNPPFTYY